MIRAITKAIKIYLKEQKKKWNSLKPVQKKFWKWFIVIKVILILILLGLFMAFIIKFKQNLW